MKPLKQAAWMAMAGYMVALVGFYFLAGGWAAIAWSGVFVATLSLIGMVILGFREPQ
jgi:hypothetical protein